MTEYPALEGLTASGLLSLVLEGDESAAVREVFCGTVAEQTREIGGWLAMSAWLGAGDQQDASATRPTVQDPTRARSFTAAGLVAQISADLMGGVQVLFAGGNDYAASALVRQLIECEYLFRAFRINFAEAARWIDANDAERWDFSPKKLRKIGGFDDQEYRQHCNMGGHPHPAAQNLLELPRALRAAQARVSGRRGRGDSEVHAARLVRLDFAFHCERTWRAMVALLETEHARFATVRAEHVAAVTAAGSAWKDGDPLARYAGLILLALSSDPDAQLLDLLAPSK